MEPLIKDNMIINGNRIAYGIHGAGQPVVRLRGTPYSSLIWSNVVGIPHGLAPKLMSMTCSGMDFQNAHKIKKVAPRLQDRSLS